jgi:hypothetical protein
MNCCAPATSARQADRLDDNLNERHGLDTICGLTSPLIWGNMGMDGHAEARGIALRQPVFVHITPLARTSGAYSEMDS